MEQFNYRLKTKLGVIFFFNITVMKFPNAVFPKIIGPEFFSKSSDLYFKMNVFSAQAVIRIFQLLIILRF